MRLQSILPLIKNDFTHKAILFYGSDPQILQFNFDLLHRFLKKQEFIIRTAEKPTEMTFSREPGLFDVPSNKEALICSKVTGSDFKEVESQITRLGKNQVMICLAVGINTKTKLVQYFQDNKNVAAVACYDLSASVIKHVILEELNKLAINLRVEQLNFMVETYQSSPISMMTDLEKISLYLEGKTSINDQDLKILINGSLQLSLDDIIKYYLLRDKKNLLQVANITILQEEAYLILRALTKQFMLFCEFLSTLKVSPNPVQAMNALSMPVFFSMRPVFTQAASHWTIKEAAQSLASLRRIELSYKNNAFSPLQFQKVLCG